MTKEAKELFQIAFEQGRRTTIFDEPVYIEFKWGVLAFDIDPIIDEDVCDDPLLFNDETLKILDEKSEIYNNAVINAFEDLDLVLTECVKPALFKDEIIHRMKTRVYDEIDNNDSIVDFYCEHRIAYDTAMTEMVTYAFLCGYDNVQPCDAFHNWKEYDKRFTAKCDPENVTDCKNSVTEPIAQDEIVVNGVIYVRKYPPNQGCS
jgi:hypothetical protein